MQIVSQVCWPAYLGGGSHMCAVKSDSWGKGMQLKADGQPGLLATGHNCQQTPAKC